MQSSMSALEAVSGFTNPFNSCFEENEAYFLSFHVPAKPSIAKEGIALPEFIDSLLAENLSFITP